MLLRLSTAEKKRQVSRKVPLGAQATEKKQLSAGLEKEITHNYGAFMHYFGANSINAPIQGHIAARKLASLGEGPHRHDRPQRAHL